MHKSETSNKQLMMTGFSQKFLQAHNVESIDSHLRKSKASIVINVIDLLYWTISLFIYLTDDTIWKQSVSKKNMLF